MEAAPCLSLFIAHYFHVNALYDQMYSLLLLLNIVNKLQNDIRKTLNFVLLKN